MPALSPVIINANAYVSGTDISGIISYVTLQQFNHAAHSDIFTYTPSVIGTSEYCPVGQPNYLSRCTNYQGSPDTVPLTDAIEFAGLSLTSIHPFNYISFTGFNGSSDLFAVLLYDADGNFINKIDGIYGVQSDYQQGSCRQLVGPPCFSFCFGTDLSGQGVYNIKVCNYSAGFINSVTIVVES